MNPAADKTRFRRPAAAVVVVVTAVGSLFFAAGKEKKPAGPSAGTLKSLLGAGPESKEIVAFRKKLKGDPQVEKYDHCFFHSWKEHGLSLRFEEDAVAAVFLYADKADGFRQYRGELPEGLLMSDTRRDVERKLGPPADVSDGVLPVYVSYPAKGLEITYVSNDPADEANPIHHVTIVAIPDDE